MTREEEFYRDVGFDRVMQLRQFLRRIRAISQKNSPAYFLHAKYVSFYKKYKALYV